MIKVGITGAAGYTAGELIRILVNHPDVEIVFTHSESNAGKAVTEVHEGLVGDTSAVFCSDFDLNGIDVLFLCSGHGRSSEFWKKNVCPKGLKVIDLAQDFRDESGGYVYGLPEWRKDMLRDAEKVANPGCFATAIQLALLPLASKGLLENEVEVTAITGSTGAGVKPGATTHFSWRNDNISSYKVFDHQHLIEIRRNLNLIQSEAGKRISEPVQVNFVPVRGDFSRGIFASVYTECSLTENEAVSLFKDCYRDAAFTFICDFPIDLKQVVNTNKCLLHIEKHGSKLVITSVIDNLLKGASGQAVQNMNIIFGLPEDRGLRLKASAF